MTEGPYSALIVEDDAGIRSLVGAACELQDMSCLFAESGERALRCILSARPDIVLLDLGLPDCDGVDLIRKVRSWSKIPIVVISARAEDADKIAALDEGADDYLVKPFSVDELMARIRVALRHAAHQEDTELESRYVNEGLEIDYAAAEVKVDGKIVHLTPMEYRLLVYLARNSGKVLTHNQILKEIWGSAFACDMPTLRVFVATLRKKIEPDPVHPRFIQTHIGVGYKMVKGQ